MQDKQLLIEYNKNRNSSMTPVISCTVLRLIEVIPGGPLHPVDGDTSPKDVRNGRIIDILV